MWSQHTLEVWIAALIVCLAARADSRTDDARLGEFYTSIPLWRSGSGTNIFSVGLGTPPQEVNLTLSTNVAFLAVAGVDCDRCLNNADQYWDEDSSSFTGTRDAFSYTTIYPTGNRDTLLLNGIFGQDRITDPRGDEQNARPIGIVRTIRENAAGDLGGTETTFSRGSSGFWGLGIFDAQPSVSLLPSLLTVTNDGQPSGASYYTVGFDIDQYSNARNAQAGTVHWGAVPVSAYQGSFAWLDVNTSVGAGWGTSIDRMRVESSVMSTDSFYATLDPGSDAIFVPTSLAEKFFDSVPAAQRDPTDRTRWNVPCDSNISVSITLGGHEYNVASSELVQSRDAAGRTCWSSMVAWENASLPEQLGEIRLGTPFLSGVYSALYYSPGQRLIGIAGKPGSVNALDVSRGEPRGANGKLAGILIGSLLTVLLIGLLLCYSRNRNSWQSMWYRSVRRQHRVQTNAMVRAATLPHPMMIPPTVPLMGPRPMGPMGPMASMGPYGPMNPYPRPPGQMGMMWGPPPYQHPMQQQGFGQQTEPPHAGQPLPAVVEHQPQGTYTTRQPTAVPSASAHKGLEQTSTSSNIQQPQMSQYQGIPHPTSQPPRRHSHQSSPGRVRWSPAAKHHSLPVSSSAETRKMPRRVSDQWRDGTQRHDAWLNHYSGVGQNQQPYPIHNPPRIETRFSTSVPAPEAGMPSVMPGRKRPWSWAKRSMKSSRGDYSPVQSMAPEVKGVEQHDSIAKGEKRRSWFGGNFKNGIAVSHGERMKREERAREREALARESGLGGMYGA